MKKIAIICYSFWPEVNPRSFRATELAKEFSRLGNSVTIYKPNVTIEQKDFGARYNLNMVNIGPYSRYRFFFGNNKVLEYFSRFTNRMMQLLFEFPDIKLYFLVKRAISRSKCNYDLCLSIAVPYPIHWGTAAGLAKNRFAKVWIADCGDPFMGDESDSFQHPFYFKYIEKWFCSVTDYLSVPAGKSINGYYKEFWNKIKIIPQGFNFEDVVLATEKHKFGCLTFGYAGGVIPNYREPFDFLDYLCEIELKFKFIVYTEYPFYFEKYKERLGDKIEINSVIERLALLYEFSKYDFVVNFDNKGSKQVASKLIDYHIIRKPILNIGFRAFEEDVFSEFVSGNYSKQYVIENPDQFKIQNVASRFLELI